MNAYHIIYSDFPDWSAVPTVELTHTPWLEKCDISARAQATHNADRLFVRMEAEEKNILAEHRGVLDSVCEDSCLEFFFAPLPKDRCYFNFEFNPLGTMYLGFGAERPTRVRQIVKDAEALFHPHPYKTEKGWGITFEIPLSFIQLYRPEADFSGHAFGNFYKCGDKTAEPHYLAWSPLRCEFPDYHRREDFGELIFDD